MKHRLVVFFLFTVALTLTLITQDQHTASAANDLLITDELRQALQKYGEIPVIISLEVPSHATLQDDALNCDLDLNQFDQISRDIASTADQLLDRLAAENISQIKRYDYFPFLAMVLDETALEALANDRAVTHITLDGNQYIVAFETRGFTPQLPGQHVHFFFNSVPPEQAGVPGSGPWYVYGGDSPFTGYTIADRPGEATQLCVLVANPDHSVIQGAGNCYGLP